MREVLGFSTAGGGKPLKGETVASEKMDNSGLGCSIKPSSIPGYLDLTPEQASRLIKTEPLTDYYDVEEEPFARGKYAAVRRCRHKSSGRHFAAKFLRKRRRSTDLRTEIIHEVAVLDATRYSPRLVRLHAVYESTHEMVLLLELACGGELQMLLDKDEVPSEHQVLRLMRQILDGLIHLHSINVAHLDIKPQNLVLTGKFPDCDVKLCDFGISRYLSEGVDVREILGTPDYVAPEVLNYEPISLATDMWSVGVLLYVLLTGCSPFGGDTKQETFCNITQCRLDFPEDIFEDISEDAKDLMRKLMVKNPSKRLSASECLQHPWFKNPRPSTSLSSTSGLSSLNIGATTPRTPTLSKRPAPTMEHSEDRSLSTDESDSDDAETTLNSKKNEEIIAEMVKTAEKTDPSTTAASEVCQNPVQEAETCPKSANSAEVDANLCQKSTKSNPESRANPQNCVASGENPANSDSKSGPSAEIDATLAKNAAKSSLNYKQDAEITQNLQQGSESVIDPSPDIDHHEDRSSTTSSCCLDHDEKSSTISSSSTLTAESCSDRCSVIGASDLGCDNLTISAEAATSTAGTTSSGTSSAGVASKGLSGERKRSFMRNMESLVHKLTYSDAEGTEVETPSCSRENVRNSNTMLEENSSCSKNINRLVNKSHDLDKFLDSASKCTSSDNDSYRLGYSSSPNTRQNKSVGFEESLSNSDTSYRLSSKLHDSLQRRHPTDNNQDLSDSSSDDSSSRRKRNQYSSDSGYESSLKRYSRLFESSKEDCSKSSSSSSDDLRSCCGAAATFSEVKRHLRGNINEDVSRTSMLKDSWYRDGKTSSSGARLRQHVDGFRSLARASGMQTMPVSSFLHYKLDCGYNFLKRGSFGYESGDESVFKFRRVFILDDADDRLSPPPSINGSLSSDNSISDSNSDTISEMSIDSSSDRSSIISLDDPLDFYGKSLAQARHYSTSCYNVWEAVKSQGTSSRSRTCPRECHGSFARALSKFTSGEASGELKDEELKEGNFHRQRKSLTIFNGYNTSTSSRTSTTTTINKKCIGLELMREHNGNVVVIREVKAVHGSKFPRCSEVKCESVQSRIRRLQVQNGIRTELAKERYNVF